MIILQTADIYRRSVCEMSCFAVCFLHCLTTMTMKSARPFGISGTVHPVTVHPVTQRDISGELKLYHYRCENLRSHKTPILEWVHTCNVTAYRNTLSWQCGRDSLRRNVSKVGYAVALRASSVCCRYLAVASKGWYGYGRSRCGRATSRCTSTPAPALTVSSLWCDGQIPTAHRGSP